MSKEGGEHEQRGGEKDSDRKQRWKKDRKQKNKKAI